MKRDELAVTLGRLLDSHALTEGYDVANVVLNALEQMGLLVETKDGYSEHTVERYKKRAKVDKRCAEPNCIAKSRSKGFCQTHYLKNKRLGLFGNTATCSVADCNKPVEAKGLCFNHYRINARGNLDR